MWYLLSQYKSWNYASLGLHFFYTNMSTMKADFLSTFSPSSPCWMRESVFVLQRNINMLHRLEKTSYIDFLVEPLAWLVRLTRVVGDLSHRFLLNSHCLPFTISSFLLRLEDATTTATTTTTITFNYQNSMTLLRCCSRILNGLEHDTTQGYILVSTRCIHYLY